MTMNDPIADMLTRIRNANLRSHKNVLIPYSKMKERIVKVLNDEGFINGFEITDNGKFRDLSVYLKYDQSKSPVIRKIERSSKPGLRLYKSYKEILPVLYGQGISIVSTSQGVISDAECRAKKVGGEILCTIY